MKAIALTIVALLAAPALAAKPKVEWTPREPEYIRSSNGAITSAGHDSGGYWVIIDPVIFFRGDDADQKRMVAYTFSLVVPERLQEKTQIRVFQEKGDGEFGPRVGTYSKRLGLKMRTKSAIAEKQPRQPVEVSRFGGRD